MDKETELQSISEENEGLRLKIGKNLSGQCEESELAAGLKKSEAVLAELKASLLDKETQLQSISEENEMLKMEIKRKENEASRVNEEAVEAARAAEREAAYNPMDSPYSEDMDDDSPKKKNGNMLKKIGVLWKKGQK
ncbi:hypothetical protein L484_024447 [Morus notabilis]|uniref:Uncharacterized protein n=1 Tax=Morus notabilis TaxID=981085 RepID=W9S5B3_9ROSA|nr:hypothetical protein L484_024447 [Morus notabilis]